MKRQAIRHALSLRAGAGAVAILEEFNSTDGRVKPTVELLAKLGLAGSVVLVVPEKTDLIERATRNIQGLQVVSAKYLNVYTVMNADHLVVTQAAIDIVREWLGGDK
jgi:large subunit ribosomal protein L4